MARHNIANKQRNISISSRVTRVDSHTQTLANVIMIVRNSSDRNSNFIIVKAPQRNKLSIRTIHPRPTPSSSFSLPSQPRSKHAKTIENSSKEVHPHPIALERQKILRLSNPVCGRRQAVDSRENESGSKLWNGVWTITQDQSEWTGKS